MKSIKNIWKHNVLLNTIILLTVFTAVTSCSKDDDTHIQEAELSSAKSITSFIFLLTNNPIDVNVIASINNEDKTINAFVPPGTDVSGLLPEIEISPRAQINTQVAQDFTNPVSYEVTAEDGSTANYTVNVTIALSQREILKTILDANPNSLVDWDLETTADLGDLNGVTTNTDGLVTKIILASKNLTSIPPELGQLSSLIELVLFQNQITSIPEEICDLSKLEVLSLFTNEITSIPTEIGQLSNLTTLSISGNNIASIPTEIGQLTNLTFLIVTQNVPISFPSEIGQLTNLKVLGIGNMQLTSLPAEVLQLTNLESLILNGNQLSSLPTEIGQLTNLTKLQLHFNEFSSFPLEMLQLTNLNHLSLDYNLLTSIPADIGRLTNLTFLSLSNNQITSLPPEMGFLSKLEYLSIRDNSFTSIPKSICNLEQFNELVIVKDQNVHCITQSATDALIQISSANPENTLGWGVDNFPGVVFDGNSNPIELSLDNTNLVRVPDDIDFLGDLEALHLSNNTIESLPATIGNMNSLQVINMSVNALNTVPDSFGQLSNLVYLILTANPITSIPQEVCDLQISNGGILTILTDEGEGCQ